MPLKSISQCYHDQTLQEQLTFSISNRLLHIISIIRIRLDMYTARNMRKHQQLQLDHLQQHQHLQYKTKLKQPTAISTANCSKDTPSTSATSISALSIEAAIKPLCLGFKSSPKAIAYTVQNMSIKSVPINEPFLYMP